MFVTTAQLTLAAGNIPGARFGFIGSVLFAAAMVSGAAMFPAIGALASELRATRGEAATLAAFVLGAAWVVRMIGDSSCHVHRTCRRDLVVAGHRRTRYRGSALGRRQSTLRCAVVCAWLSDHSGCAWPSPRGRHPERSTAELATRVAPRLSRRGGAETGRRRTAPWTGFPAHGAHGLPDGELLTRPGSSWLRAWSPPAWGSGLPAPHR